MRTQKSPIKKDISIVIPCYKEERYIKKTLEDVTRVLRSIPGSFEIICVVDGIVDKTFNIASDIAKKSKGKIRVVGYPKNRGKGYALRVGFSLCNGQVIGFIDADGQIAPEALKSAVLILRKSGLDIVVGSKAHRKSQVEYSFFRNSVSIASQILIKMLFGLEVSDTQAGLKVFKGEIIKMLLPRLTMARFGSDIELLSVARYLGYDKFGEIPIQVKMLKEDITGPNLILFIKDVTRTFIELFPLIYRLKIVHYYDKANKSSWMKFTLPKLLRA